MSNTDYQHIVTMRSALDCVAPRSERLLNKLAPVVAAEDDVGPAVIRRLCRTSLLERLGLTTAEQQLVLKAILAALQGDSSFTNDTVAVPLLDMSPFACKNRVCPAALPLCKAQCILHATCMGGQPQSVESVWSSNSFADMQQCTPMSTSNAGYS